MKGSRTLMHKWFGDISQSGRRLAAIVFIVVLAFVLGFILAGGNGARTSDKAPAHDHAAGGSSEPTAWTCSMHPQIQLPRPGKCPICFMDLIPQEKGGGGDLGPRELKMSEAARDLARIQTAPVRRASAETEIRMVGKITYDETRVYSISAWVPGRLDSLYVDYVGERVGKGDPLVYLYSPELLSAQEELIQARRAVSRIDGGSTVLKSTAQATLEAARKKLNLFGLTGRQIERLELSDTADDHVTIYAPAGGIVIAKNATEGEFVTTGSDIYTIADLSRLWVVFEAYETDLPWLRPGQNVSFTTPSLPGRRFEGEITFIEPLVDPKTRTVVARAVVDNRSGSLKPDMFVSGIVRAGAGMDGMEAQFASVTESDAPPLLIPASAPLITGTRAVVYVEKSRDNEIIYEGREVILGPRAGDFYVVTSGLNEGERVVINGAFRIDSELQIQARPSMMSPEGAGSIHQHAGQEVQSGDGAGDHKEHRKDTRAYPISDEARGTLTPVYEAYLQVQAALADDDLTSAMSSFDTVGDAASRVDMGLFTASAHQEWMDFSRRISQSTGQGIDAGTIEDAREAFRDLSDAIIELHAIFGHSGEKTLYLTYCPMAFGNTGAYWIQAIDTVYNPYFGARMLHCGEIKETLSPHATGNI